MGNSNSGNISHYTPEKADIIIQALASGLQPITGAEMAGISRMTAYNWRNQYPEFAQRWEDAKASANEKVEEVVWRHAVSGNLAAAFFWLRSHKAQIYDRATMAKITMMKSILQSQAVKGGGRLTIEVDENGIPQIVESAEQKRVVIFIPDNGRDTPHTSDPRTEDIERQEPIQYDLVLEQPAPVIEAHPVIEDTPANVIHPDFARHKALSE